LLAIVTTDVPTTYDLNVRLGRYFLDDRVDLFLSRVPRDSKGGTSSGSSRTRAA